MRLSLRTMLLLGAALATSACAQATQIVLVIDSDLVLTTVDVDVSSTNSPPSHASADFSMPATPSLPLTLALYPRGASDIEVFVTVIGTMADGTRIERDVRTRFVSGSSRMLRVLLASRCLDHPCAAGQTCDETGCRDITIGGDSLPDWTGSAPSLSGMAACAAVDEICNGDDDDCDMRADESFDLSSDPAHCGACGNACAGGTCTNGFCTGEQIVGIAAGGAHTCAVAMNGRVTCWGWNDQDQLGTEEAEANSVPARVGGVMNVGSVAAGGLHTCVLETSGRAGCFGDGQDGALGRGTNLDSADYVPVAGTASFGAIAAGIGTSCGITDTHDLLCWGANDQGQLGDGTATPSSMPATVVMANVAAVSMGFQHGCAVTTSGELWCWGSNALGQCGTGVPTMPGAPVQVPGVTDAAQVACGRGFTCFTHADHTIDCMGDNTRGQLGDGTETSSATPVHVMAVTDAASLSAPSAGNHVCAVRSTGLLVCWGANASGQLGDGTTTMHDAPVMVPMPLDVAAVAAGGLADDGTGHTCALDMEGRVWCWGDGALGQLGTGDFMARARPTIVLGAVAP